MRVLLPLAGLVALTAAAPARDWSNVAAKTPAGAYVIGNPAARVKLIEYASYTCSHCADFANQSAPVLKDRMIRSGQVSLELRHVVFNALDLAAAVLARCTGPRRFAATTQRLFATQGQWLTAGAKFGQANGERLAKLPPPQLLRQLADGAGLTQLSGVPSAAADACFADRAEIDRITGMQGDVGSTPTFILNGKRLPPQTWASLEPQLRAAGVR